MSPLTPRLLTALTTLFVATIVAGGLGACTEISDEYAPATTHEEPSTFDVHPTLVMEGTALSNNVLVTRAFLGIGSVILEPLDDLEAPVISNRHPTALAFTLDQDGEQVLSLPTLQLVDAGRYLVTIAIEPQLDDSLSTTHATLTRKSVEIEGVYFSVTPNPVDPIASPEPVPWKPMPFNQSQTIETLQRADITHHPFTYVSARTGYVRVGEVELNPQQRELGIHIHMDAWLNDAIAPVMAELVESPEAPTTEGTTLDISSRIESNGAGLERLFFSSEAEAL